MGTIRILAADVANRIAAGEVVERPASVVKELVENAIDAGAGRIRVQTAEGGQRLIHVTDDGCGMDREDALLCLEAHATSKIRDSADVGQIHTLGFRGEALPSIAAVSRFQLQTRRAEDAVGTEVLVEAGTLRDVRDCGCAAGTSIRVSHLFASMPARRKFLRGAHTEDGHIQEVVLLQALAHPEVTVEYVAGDREVLRVPAGGDLAMRIGLLMGRDVLRELLPVEYTENGIRVHGFVARPGFTRSSRREQRVFVNGRPASAEEVHYGIREAYHTLVIKGRYPPVVLFLELGAERVDVNVHPAKREVRFREGHLVRQIVAAAVSRGLRGMAFSPTPEGREAPSTGVPDVAPAAHPFRLSPGAHQPQLPLERLPPRPQIGQTSPEPARPAVLTAPETPSAPPPDAGAPADAPPADASPARPRPQEQEDTAVRGEIASLRVLGLYGERFIVAEGPRGLVLIDQAAAHQRVLFEQLLHHADCAHGLRQQLLLPATVDLGTDDARRLRQYLDDFVKLGFSIDHFGGNTFLVSAVPARFPAENVAGLLRQILDELRDRGHAAPAPEEVRIARAACRCAVRPTDALTHDEIARLLRELARADMPYTCPNGLPVMVNISTAEITRRFGRSTPA
ncbi:MAG: DNA mismatch repair endonuclease MutL [Lentisphaeria bacterium]|nr:DNA mismatch repair endonuclease MutL [Lentisphaeria bacterium]